MRRVHTLFISLFLVIFVGVCLAGDEIHASFTLRSVPLPMALDSLHRWYPISIVYLDADVEGKFVSAECRDCSAEEALTNVLRGTSLMWIKIGNQVILRIRPVEEPRPVATISGVISDSMASDGVPDAAVLIEDQDQEGRLIVRRWCSTNQFGFYSLRNIPPGKYTLRVRALGYRMVQVPLRVTSAASVRHDIQLPQEEITLQEVTVEGRRAALSSAEGFSKGVYVRAAPSDQHQYFLDGARIYNPTHYGGVLSTFNPEMLNDVQVVMGGVPPYYGGRIGGILDLSVRDGRRDRLSLTVGAGTLGLQGSLEGPLADATTFLVSARRGYPTPMVPLLKDHGVPSRLGSTEIMAKLSSRLSGSDRLSLSGYLAKDTYDNAVNGPPGWLSNNLWWENSSLNLRWIGIASPLLFMHAAAAYSRYAFSLEHTAGELDPMSPVSRFASNCEIQDFSLRAHAEHYYDEHHTIRGGVELIRHRLARDISPFSSQVAYRSLQTSSSWELSVYFQDQWKIVPQVTAEVGARATSYSGDQGTFSAIDPRFSLLFSLDETTRMYGALTTVNQFIHPYRNSGVFLFYPTVFWYPSTEQMKPTTSFQATLGVQKSLGEEAYVVSVEPYFRLTGNLHEFGSDTSSSPNQELSDHILYGTGKSYGMECTVRKRTGDLRGTLSYTLSWAQNTFAALNGGEPFTPRFDRRHEVKLSVSYLPDDRWTFGALCVVASEQPPTFEPTPVGDRGHYGALEEVVDVNGSRLPGFQRLELTVSRTVFLGTLPCQLSLRLLSGYGLLDPFVWELRRTADIRRMWSVRLGELKLVPLFPTLGVSIKL